MTKKPPTRSGEAQAALGRRAPVMDHRNEPRGGTTNESRDLLAETAPALSVTRGTYGKWICLDWYDGPLTEIALVTFADGKQLVELKCQGGWVGKDYRVGRNGEKFFDNHMRLDRNTLAAMLDLLDGKPVKDFHDDEG